MSQTNDGPTYGGKRAGAALAVGVLVKLTSDKWAAAALGERPLGVTLVAAFADGDEMTVKFLNAPGTIKCKASGTFSAGAAVYGRASGLIDDISTTSAVLIGTALEACTGANDLIEVVTV